MRKNGKILLFMLLTMLSISLVACKSDIDYEIYEITDSHIGDTERFIYNIVVNEPVSIDDMKLICDKVVKIAKKDTPFNALSIEFYDYADYIDIPYRYTLGYAHYAPYGDWPKAVDIKTGDYSNMEFDYYLQEKDWDTQLTDDEVTIVSDWWNKLNDMHDDGLEPVEDDVTMEISKKYNISTEEVDNLISKLLTWSYNDLNK